MNLSIVNRLDITHTIIPYICCIYLLYITFCSLKLFYFWQNRTYMVMYFIFSKLSLEYRRTVIPSKAMKVRKWCPMPSIPSFRRQQSFCISVSSRTNNQTVVAQIFHPKSRIIMQSWIYKWKNSVVKILMADIGRCSDIL